MTDKTRHEKNNMNYLRVYVIAMIVCDSLTFTLLRLYIVYSVFYSMCFVLRACVIIEMCYIGVIREILVLHFFYWKM